MSYVLERTPDGHKDQIVPGDHISLTYHTHDLYSYRVLKVNSVPETVEQIHLGGPILTIWVRASQYRAISTNMSVNISKAAFTLLMTEDEDKVHKILVKLYESAAKAENDIRDQLRELVMD